MALVKLRIGADCSSNVCISTLRSDSCAPVGNDRFPPVLLLAVVAKRPWTKPLCGIGALAHFSDVERCP